MYRIVPKKSRREVEELKDNLNAGRNRKEEGKE